MLDYIFSSSFLFTLFPLIVSEDKARIQNVFRSVSSSSSRAADVRMSRGRLWPKRQPDLLEDISLGIFYDN